MAWSMVQADALEWLRSLEDDSVDLLFTSPPYELARTYGLKDKMKGGQAWVDWMVEVVKAASPKVKGLIAINCEGQTRNFAYSGAPFLLFADLHRAGFKMRKPPIFRRQGIPGSGGPDWLRNDYEPIICVTRLGKLPWSNNTAMGHIPKWGPGGEMSNRVSSGARVNQWGSIGSKKGGGAKKADGTYKARGRPSHVEGRRLERGNPKGSTKGRRGTCGHRGGDTAMDTSYLPPVLANPGNVITCKVGGGHMGHELAHENEAPFPLALPEFFVKSFCPPDGLVIDPFAGSGTVLHAAVKHGRNADGCDLRESQVELTKRRMASVQPELFI